MNTNQLKTDLKKKNSLYGRVAIILLIILAYYALNSFPCYLLKYKATPENITGPSENNIHYLVFLYGKKICSICPTGEFLLNISDREDILYFVPEDFSVHGVENLQSTYEIAGKITKGTSESVAFLKKVLSCLKSDESKKNIFIELKKNRKIGAIKSF